jgi:hypothetical protein
MRFAPANALVDAGTSWIVEPPRSVMDRCAAGGMARFCCMPVPAASSSACGRFTARPTRS